MEIITIWAKRVLRVLVFVILVAASPWIVGFIGLYFGWVVGWFTE